MNLALTILCLGSIGWIHRKLPPLPGAVGTGLAALIAIAVLAIVTMLQLTAVDGWLYHLASRPPLRGFFTRNYTHAFGRYRAPGFHIGAKEQQS